MAQPNLSLKDISVRLFRANAVKFENVTTQTGAVTPVYFDLRVIVSFPSLMKDLSILLSQCVQQLAQQQQNKVLVCGVPFTAVPITTLVSVHTNIPMILKRKQAKNYGTKALIEGVWSKGDCCILIDDVIMFGDSILETVRELRDSGLDCSEVVVICDRQQGAVEKVKRKGINVHSLLTLTDIMEHLLEEGLISRDKWDMVHSYLATSQVNGCS